MLWFYLLLFFACCAVFYFVGELVVSSLMRIAIFLGWREFVVAFIVVAFASSLPNLFVGISSALQGIPQLSFGDVAGNNLVALTMGVALATFFSKGCLVTDSRAIQTTAGFTMVSAIMPIILILDGNLSRIDGIILIGFFCSYVVWLFSKKERFTKTYDGHKVSPLNDFKNFFKDLMKVFLGVLLLILSSQGIVKSAEFFANNFHMSLIAIGLLITGVGSALPELYFAIASAKKNETWLVLGDLMGAVIIPATLVLGTVALISPFTITDFSAFFVARIFLIIAAVFFYYSIRSGKHICRKEATILILIYIGFLVAENLIN
ncbi:MAG: sodium:calcium antiporter [Parcubacteria group bacterium]|nr:MAG: sodium:calcium antiporter [Parcubacteria group bacterium]